jgi:hypothetical protein
MLKLASLQFPENRKRAQRAFRSDEPYQRIVRSVSEHYGARSEDSLEHHTAGRARYSDNDIASSSQAGYCRPDAHPLNVSTTAEKII